MAVGSGLLAGYLSGGVVVACLVAPVAYLASKAVSTEEVAVVSGNKAFFMSCYSRCRPFCPSGGCSPDALWGRLVNEDI